MLNELQRQAYLQSMGVDGYFPRRLLPGALASTQCELPVLPAVESIPELPARSAPKQRTGPVRASELLDLPQAIKPGTETESLAPVQGEIPTFSLSVSAVAGRLLIVDDCPLAQLRNRDYLTLLQNIVLALGLGKQQLAMHSFQWPETMKGHADRGAAAASQALQAFLARQLELGGIGQLLLMGEAASRFAADKDLPRATLLPYEPAEATVLSTLSASRMLAEPELKRDLWQQLQPLCQLFKNA